MASASLVTGSKCYHRDNYLVRFLLASERAHSIREIDSEPKKREPNGIRVKRRMPTQKNPSAQEKKQRTERKIRKSPQAGCPNVYTSNFNCIGAQLFANVLSHPRCLNSLPIAHAYTHIHTRIEAPVHTHVRNRHDARANATHTQACQQASRHAVIRTYTHDTIHGHIQRASGINTTRQQYYR